MCDRQSILPLESIDQGAKARYVVRLGGARSRVVDLVTALAALVGPGEVSNRDDEEAGTHQHVDSSKEN